MKKWIRRTMFSLLLMPLSAMAVDLVNINTADATTLEQVNGIGPVKAKAIVAYRQSQGSFASVDELIKVPGIGSKSVDKMRAQLTVGGQGSAAAPAPGATAPVEKR